MKLKMTICLLAGAMMSTFTPTAHADQPRLPQLTLSMVSGINSVPAAAVLTTPSPRECKTGYLAGPATGVAVGSAALAGSGLLIAPGAHSFFRGSDQGRAMVAGGSVLAAAGLGTLIYSAIKLKRKRQARELACR